MAVPNEEGGDGGFVTTVTFEEQGGTTLVACKSSMPRNKSLEDDSYIYKPLSVGVAVRF